LYNLKLRTCWINAVGVSVDKMLIELEESLNREEFKREILSAVQEARVEFKAKLSSENDGF